MQIHNDSHAKIFYISCIRMASAYFYPVSHTEAAFLWPFITLVKKKGKSKFSNTACGWWLDLYIFIYSSLDSFIWQIMAEAQRGFT